MNVGRNVVAGFVAVLVACFGCGSGTGTEAGDANGGGARDTGIEDKCSGITCSGRGTCAVVKGDPECACDEGYYPDGLNCLPLDKGDAGKEDAGPKDAGPDAATDTGFDGDGGDAGKHDASADASGDAGKEDAGEDDAALPEDAGDEGDGGDGGDVGDTGQPACQHLCYPQGKIECIGTDGYRDCEDFNSDGCFEWSDKLSCGASATCINNACTCNSGFANCDSDWFTGCETNLSSDARHCGDCATDCGQHSVCNLKQCACEVGYGNCNTIWTDGCETDLNALTTCGTDCANITACSSYNGTDPRCESGTCTLTCPDPNPWGGVYVDDCNAQPGKSDGCEADLRVDDNNCGECGQPCDKPNMYCRNSTCQCEIGFSDCDSNPYTGCETNLGADFFHCGSCYCNCTYPTAYCVQPTCNAPAGCTACTNGRCY
ncbi:MAG: hypothetical protein HY897_19930 [Deltaproteobacteria bacterium]|nr:hypothetical protein [Deltaproteobacteria bacterium]